MKGKYKGKHEYYHDIITITRTHINSNGLSNERTEEINNNHEEEITQQKERIKIGMAREWLLKS